MKTVKMTKLERMKAALRGDGELREDDQMNVHVIGITDDGTEISLGHVTASLILQDPEAAWACIERIRFGE